MQVFPRGRPPPRLTLCSRDAASPCRRCTFDQGAARPLNPLLSYVMHACFTNQGACCPLDRPPAVVCDALFFQGACRPLEPLRPRCSFTMRPLYAVDATGLAGGNPRTPVFEGGHAPLELPPELPPEPIAPRTPCCRAAVLPGGVPPSGNPAVVRGVCFARGRAAPWTPCWLRPWPAGLAVVCPPPVCPVQ